MPLIQCPECGLNYDPLAYDGMCPRCDWGEEAPEDAEADEDFVEYDWDGDDTDLDDPEDFEDLAAEEMEPEEEGARLNKFGEELL